MCIQPPVCAMPREPPLLRTFWRSAAEGDDIVTKGGYALQRAASQSLIFLLSSALLFVHNEHSKFTASFGAKRSSAVVH